MNIPMRDTRHKPETLQDWLRNASLVCVAVAVVFLVLNYMVFTVTSKRNIQAYPHDLSPPGPDDAQRPTELIPPAAVVSEGPSAAPVPSASGFPGDSAPTPVETPPSDLAAMLESRSASAPAIRTPETDYAPFVVQAGLTPDQAARFYELIRRRASAGVNQDVSGFDPGRDDGDLDELRRRREAALDDMRRQFRELLGARGVQALETYEAGVPAPGTAGSGAAGPPGP